MNSAMKHSFGAELSRIEGKIGESASWPSPGTGLAFHILQLINDGQPHWPPSVKLSFPEGQLDTAPLIAAAGYSMCVAAPNSDQFARWQSALHRFTKRDPFPRDRQTFAFRPSELVAIALGISKSNVGGSPAAAWIRSVVETLPAKNPAQDAWALLIHHYAAALVGIPWPMSLPSRLTDYELPELCLLYALLSQGKIPQPTEVDNRRVAKEIVQRTVAMTQDVREPEKLAALVAGISLALRSEVADFDAESANPAPARLRESEHPQKSPCDDSSRPLVVLVHGIRTSGKWIRRIKPVLEGEGGCVVEPAGFGFFDVFRFLLPGPTRKSVIETVRWKLLHAVDRHKGRPLVIVAHSFGTYCITEILKDSPQIRPARLLFCGSIVAQNFRWDSLSQMAPDRGMRVVNECGARDIWPPLAHSVTFGYGYSGNRGFQTPGIDDRYHNLGHSGYFTKEFVRKYWVPFVKDGTITHSEFEDEMPESPWWISLIGLRPILPWLLWILLAVISFVTIAALNQLNGSHSNGKLARSASVTDATIDSPPSPVGADFKAIQDEVTKLTSTGNKSVENRVQYEVLGSGAQAELKFPVPEGLAVRIRLYLERAGPRVVDSERPEITLNPERGDMLYFLLQSKVDMLPFLRFSSLNRSDAPRYRTITDWTYSDLRSHQNMRGSFLAGANLEYSNLSNLDLSGSVLVWAVLRNCKLSNASLYGCNANQAEFTNADLSGVDLESCLLVTADLRNAKLTGVRNWKNCKITEANIYGVRDAPDGFVEWAMGQGAISEENPAIHPANIDR